MTELLLLSNSRAPGQGETRQQRIEEFLEENDVPVLGLREGAWLGVSGDRAILAGTGKQSPAPAVTQLAGRNRRNVTLRRLYPSQCHIAPVSGSSPDGHGGEGGEAMEP
jgi:hypothetical protein